MTNEPDADEGMSIPDEPMPEDGGLLDEPEDDEDIEDAPPAEPGPDE